MVRTTDDEAWDMVAKHQKLLRFAVHKFIRNLPREVHKQLGAELVDELESAGQEAMFKAAKNFDPAKGRWSTFVVRALFWRFQQVVRTLLVQRGQASSTHTAKDTYVPRVSLHEYEDSPESEVPVRPLPEGLWADELAGASLDYNYLVDLLKAAGLDDDELYCAEQVWLNGRTKDSLREETGHSWGWVDNRLKWGAEKVRRHRQDQRSIL